MRQVYVVGTTDDGTHLLLAGSPQAQRASTRLAIDDRLRRALRGELGAPGRRPAESALSPREVQARLRAGQTPEQVARAAGVPVPRVLRFAAPVMAERDRMVEEARAAVMPRARRGPSALPLGEAVDAHLASTPGLRPDSVEWAARRREDGTWEVGVRFVARGRSRSASWSYTPGDRQVAALDTAAANLGFVPPPGEPERPRRAKAAKKAVPARKTAPAKKAAAARRTAPAKKTVPARKTAPKKTAPAKKVARRRPAPKPSVPSWSEVLFGVQRNP